MKIENFLFFFFCHKFMYLSFTQILDNYVLLLRTTRFLMIMQLLLFLFSFFGSKLMANSSDIATRLANISWYQLKSKNVKKYFILMILRAQQREGIRAGKFFYITFQSFLDSMNCIVSYFSVLRALVFGKT